MPSRQLPGLGLNGFWTVGEDGWGPGNDQNLRTVSALCQLSVLDQDLTAPPGSPTDGDIYIVGQGATGAWSGQDGKVVIRDNGTWVYLDARTGLVAYVEDEQLFYKYDSGWFLFAAPVAFESYVNFDDYIAADTWTIVDLNNAPHNDQAVFTAANGRFTAPVDGYYDLSFEYHYKTNGTAPTAIYAGLGVNGVNPTDQRVSCNPNALVSEKSVVSVRAVLKLSATDYVNAMAFMETNDGFVFADKNSFTGHKV